MRILLTGAAGFIGSHLAAHLLARGDEVVGLDCLDETLYDKARHRDNLIAISTHPGFSLHLADLCDPAAVTTAITGCDAVIHLGALAGVRPSLTQAPRYMRVNVEGTAVVLHAATQAGIRRVVAASSSSVYGARCQVPFREDDPALCQASPYGASKRAMELVCAAWAELHDMSITALRFFTVYGPRQRPDMAVSRFAERILKGLPVPLYGDGQSSRDYTYIDDIVAGTCLALDRARPGYRAYNLGSGSPVTLQQLLSHLTDALQRKARTEHLPKQPGDVPRTFADLALARAELGYQPRVDLALGLRRYAAWLTSR